MAAKFRGAGNPDIGRAEVAARYSWHGPLLVARVVARRICGTGATTAMIVARPWHPCRQCAQLAVGVQLKIEGLRPLYG